MHTAFGAFSLFSTSMLHGLLPELPGFTMFIQEIFLLTLLVNLAVWNIRMMSSAARDRRPNTVPKRPVKYAPASRSAEVIQFPAPEVYLADSMVARRSLPSARS